MKAFRIFIAVCGVMAIIWMTVSLFHEGFNPSSQTNALIIGALFLLLGVEIGWMIKRNTRHFTSSLLSFKSHS
ncbi:hypothetical protein [Halobacillus trueperi]|uniref:Uncharacterized protein n=1 Tax=Halobacillus trueperi TaxID=156205 RepID=A0A3E0J8G7_9BACI|nr:hypothetical protein [Halobacillus trueperi]REJ09054.1 hypothetical protein DYE48_11795 [Halobacillus trueperi]